MYRSSIVNLWWIIELICCAQLWRSLASPHVLFPLYFLPISFFSFFLVPWRQCASADRYPCLPCLRARSLAPSLVAFATTIDWQPYSSSTNGHESPPHRRIFSSTRTCLIRTWAPSPSSSTRRRGLGPHLLCVCCGDRSGREAQVVGSRPVSVFRPLFVGRTTTIPPESQWLACWAVGIATRQARVKRTLGCRMSQPVRPIKHVLTRVQLRDKSCKRKGLLFLSVNQKRKERALFLLQKVQADSISN